MKQKLGRFLLGATLGCSAALGAQAGTAWDESLSGDLSNDGLAPTPITVVAGSNLVLGTVGNAGQGVDRDYFRFTVPPGATLTSINLLPNTFVSGGASFFAMQVGSQVTVTPTGGGVQSLLGFLHYDSSQIGTNLLPTIAPSYPGGLPSGTYSVWVQETGGVVPYGFDFVITTAPVPASDAPLPLWAYCALGMLFLWFGSRRLSQQSAMARRLRL